MKCLAELNSNCIEGSQSFRRQRFEKNHMFCAYYTAAFVVTLTQSVLVRCNSQQKLEKSCDNGVCSREENQGPCYPDNDEPRLFRWDPNKVYLSLEEFLQFDLNSNEYESYTVHFSRLKQLELTTCSRL